LCMASLFPGSLGLSSRPAWATVMWDVPLQDPAEQGTGTGSQCSYRPCPAEQLQPSSAQLVLTLGSLEVACLTCSALCLLHSGVSLLCCLCRNVKRCLREVSDGDRAGTCCQGAHSCKNYELICQLKENPDLMKSYLRHLRHCYLEEELLQRQGKNMWEDLEEEETHFSS
ncbi:hypothetical protein N338_08018, partial [Podiceps cristatus]